MKGEIFNLLDFGEEIVATVKIKLPELATLQKDIRKKIKLGTINFEYEK